MIEERPSATILEWGPCLSAFPRSDSREGKISVREVG